MPEATILFAVTAVVVVGLLGFVAYVLTRTTERWARPPEMLPAGLGELGAIAASAPGAAIAAGDIAEPAPAVKKDDEPT